MELNMDLMLLIGQTFMLLILAGWLLFGVKDNWQHPDLNGSFVSIVMRMERLQEMFPEEYEEHKYRILKSETLHNFLFRSIVIWETIACLILWIGVAAMVGAIFGAVDVETARMIAMAGAMAFTSIWASFVVFGNHWLYWMCHEWAQNIHVQLATWGMLTMVFLALVVKFKIA